MQAGIGERRCLAGARCAEDDIPGQVVNITEALFRDPPQQRQGFLEARLDFADFGLAVGQGFALDTVDEFLVLLAAAINRDDDINQPYRQNDADGDQPGLCRSQRLEIAQRDQIAVKPDDDAERDHPQQRQESAADESRIALDIGADRIKIA
ncbi:hypothetical protein D3C87_1017960 [compost metagenome]